jgi:nucleoid DNA-binding protein
MDKYEFIKYTSQRYGIDEGVAETMVDMFADSLHDLVSAGYSVNIDEIGEFKTTPLFPNGLNHRNNIALARAAKRNIVSFIPSNKLTSDVA